MTQTQNDRPEPDRAPEQMPEQTQVQTQPMTQPLTEQTTPVVPEQQPQGFAIPPQGFAMAAAAVADPAAAPKPKRRLGSGKLFAGALVLGVLGGVGTGYGVQSSRPPTPLPSLAGTQPHYRPGGVYQGIAPSTLPASQDDATRTEGDLTKLLLSKPAGASDADSDWVDQMIDVAQDAYLCNGDQSKCYISDYNDGVEAIADTQWTTSDGFFVEIRMFRFKPGSSGSAREWATDDTEAVSNQIPLPDGIEASGGEFRDSYGANDDHVEAVHGDILVSFWVTSSTKMPNPSLIDGLITQQMARL